ncbi:MAG: meso-butanediol dehydrogenase/(S,S)-butanediol dehydrogenase/diacetyl reductase [Pseudohongiellaceae bacterium]|jgi:meso-butanediol dehydrogenase/(S,S)-butanediol dehydrogenase/diacetyl reductase
MKGLQHKRVVVTGGAKGIGRATALRFLEEGSRVIVIDRDGEACAELRREASGLDELLVADVSQKLQVLQAFATIDERWGGLDVLINNAGISTRHSFLEITVEAWRETMATNLTGLFMVAQQAARRMLAVRSGVILNMGSMNAHVGCPDYADYNASKAGVIELTRTMALELAPSVRVLSVSPGAVVTPMQVAEYTAEMFAEIDAKIPLGRHGQPEEIAALFAFLASDEARFMTGTSVVIDGGESAGGLASQARPVE